MVGSAGARITLVEFADYECPHCKRFQPVLRQILDEFKGEVKLYFKHYPLPQHTQARMAAEAATAAQKQGKFWPYEEKLWANQDNLTQAELEKYAKETGLDMAKFRQDMESPGVKARVQKDRTEGSAAGISSTPTLFINGREYSDTHDTESLREWIKEELQK
jgi:protein-disulfide isomerase